MSSRLFMDDPPSGRRLVTVCAIMFPTQPIRYDLWFGYPKALGLDVKK